MHSEPPCRKGGWLEEAVSKIVETWEIEYGNAIQHFL